MRFLMFLRDSDRNMTAIVAVMYCDVLEGDFNDIIVTLRTSGIICIRLFLLRTKRGPPKYLNFSASDNSSSLAMIHASTNLGNLTVCYFLFSP